MQLMTVHSAKGLEFPHVFILRLSKGDFPTGARKPVFEFPPELMKEEKPKGRFSDSGGAAAILCGADARAAAADAFDDHQQAQEAVAVSRRFSDGSRRSRNSTRCSRRPRCRCRRRRRSLVRRPTRPTRRSFSAARGENARAYSRVALWAKAFHPPRPEPLQLSASAIDAYERCPMKYMFQYMWNIRGGPHAQMTFGNVMHTTIKEFVGEMRKHESIVPLRGSARDLRTRMVLGGILRRISRSRNTARPGANNWKPSIAAYAARPPTCCTRKRRSSCRSSTTWWSRAGWTR